eukprot:2403404-Amphidinium_carterae.1
MAIVREASTASWLQGFRPVRNAARLRHYKKVGDPGARCGPDAMQGLPMRLFWGFQKRFDPVWGNCFGSLF